MRGLIVFLLGLFGVVFFAAFLGIGSVKAAESTIVINEVYSYNKTGEVEWIELYNKTDSGISLDDYTIEDGTGSSKSLSPCFILANEYLVLEKGSGICRFGFTLNNDGDIIILKRLGIIIDQVTYGTWDDKNIEDNAPVSTQGESITRIPNGIDTDIDKEDFTVQETLTQGSENPMPPKNTAPSIPELYAPANGLELIKGEEIEFGWEGSIDLEGSEVSYGLYLGCNETLTKDDLVDSGFLEIEYPISVEKDCEKYYWKVEATDGLLTSSSLVYNFTLEKPVYSDDILINELMPDPDGDETAGEWIELFNDSSEAVNLKGWMLEDLKGSIHRYTIDTDLMINANGYLIFYREDTGITLNNDQDGDGVRLYQPDENLLYETPVFSGGDEKWTWARKSTGVWDWTTTPTSGKINVLTLPKEEEEAVGGGEEDPVIPVNLVPIKIKTGSYRNYQYKRVEVEGQVAETSGNTFYLDDGSGRAKIYIQDKTGIDKPKMGKGDIFWVSGIVNLYRTTWRILPQIQSDIKLIQAAIKPEKEAETKAKASTAKKAATSSSKKSVATASTARAPNQIIPQVKAAEDGVNSKTKVKAATPIWMQIVEVITSLAGIFLVLLIIRVIKVPKPKVIGGKFGEDDT